MAVLKTVHTLQLTTKELSILAYAMRSHNQLEPYDDPENPCLTPLQDALDLEKLLRSALN